MWTIFDNIKYLYGVNAYTNDNLIFFVENETITKVQYKIITGTPYPEAPTEPIEINVIPDITSMTIEAK